MKNPKIQFISRTFFGKGERTTKPRKPWTGPRFERPKGSRDPAAEARTNLENGIIRNWGC